MQHWSSTMGQSRSWWSDQHHTCEVTLRDYPPLPPVDMTETSIWTHKTRHYIVCACVALTLFCSVSLIILCACFIFSQFFRFLWMESDVSFWLFTSSVPTRSPTHIQHALYKLTQSDTSSRSCYILIRYVSLLSVLFIYVSCYILIRFSIQVTQYKLRLWFLVITSGDSEHEPSPSQAKFALGNCLLPINIKTTSIVSQFTDIIA